MVVTPTKTSSKDKFLIFKEGEVKSLTEGGAHRDDWA